MRYNLYQTVLFAFIAAAGTLASPAPLEGSLEDGIEDRATRQKANEYKSTDW